MCEVWSVKRGQAAVEYLVTYGWVFVVILAAIGALSYFDLLSPGQYLPTRCEFGQQLTCEDVYVDVDKDVVLRFKNLFAANITIVDGYIFDESTESMVSFYTGPDVTIPVNGIGRVDFDASGVPGSFTENRKERIRMIVTFQRQGGTAQHNITGLILAEVSEDLI